MIQVFGVLFLTNSKPRFVFSHQFIKEMNKYFVRKENAVFKKMKISEEILFIVHDPLRIEIVREH